eukprot:CAMPEP_0181238582 /NCGR_PEP_ID=MMETSP1096-20121128/39435_1 /TAXON_ID=156174 ORGANISM="Chrysochromulina ericina, Strain CCMP281" /NCGR_SAMPLE_ID=MMETSP1096 /ASSEMBLY_ACC=CAM_ASM_000453 /LENGTH=72 /DNA_ID=CAMNT_0023334137 /DNA_START=621 /DNA_END=839 /DNA_ORIENTATION=+
MSAREGSLITPPCEQREVGACQLERPPVGRAARLAERALTWATSAPLGFLLGLIETSRFSRLTLMTASVGLK